MSRIRIIKHEIASLKSGSFEVRFTDGRAPRYFYFDDHPGRRAIAGNLVDRKRALHEARTLARGEMDRIRVMPSR